MRKNYKKITAAILLSLSIIIILQLGNIIPIFAQYTITTSIPGTQIQSGASAQGRTLAWYVSQIYLFAFGIVGLLALGSIIFHALLYTMSAGNASKMSDAMGGIRDALWGLVLLIFAYLILWTINPSLVTLVDFGSYIQPISRVTSSGPNPNTNIGSGQGNPCYGPVGTQADCRAGFICASNNPGCTGTNTCLPAEPSCNNPPQNNPPVGSGNTVGGPCNAQGLCTPPLHCDFSGGAQRCIPASQRGSNRACTSNSQCYSGVCDTTSHCQ